MLYYQNYNNGQESTEVEKGKEDIGYITTSLNTLDKGLSDISKGIDDIKTDLENLGNLVGNIELNSNDIPTFDDILNNIDNDNIEGTLK